MVLVALVAAAAFGVHWHGGGGLPSLGAAAAADPGPEAEPIGPPPLVPGHDYYVHLKLVEFRPQGPGGEAWDWGDSGPDPVYRIAWQGNTVHTSSTRGDTLIGSWDLFAADVKEVMIDQQGRVDVETLVDAPLIQYQPGTTFRLTVADDEPLGMGETVALDTELVMDHFHLGDNAVRFRREEQPSIARLILTFTDRQAPLPDLLQVLSNR
ncbi:hypothetical protein PSMK_00040 [Phycisphaera mikurensis NBRC 102666]|uniref:Uncharacterized protein n=1 Tax=Phycisphaera mikurensis (strain NBRC 102666 / KCTC 22515 / FYK2301M01) TaxID=1142394 RepID=I0IA75_PHYMF|nr:hypothetical protein PSMK_00040 [Phycisphaera mikurensis NBRC 102666]